jgi:phage/plasmid-associated DNA primase
MILIPFRATIAENDPTRIANADKAWWWQASGELPGILNWALTGLDRLRRQNHFTQSQVCNAALGEYRIENNPARMFLLQTCEEKPDATVPCRRLYQSYREWCSSSGYFPLADHAFGKEVRRVFPKVIRKEIGPRSGRQHFYCGLSAEGLLAGEV